MTMESINDELNRITSQIKHLGYTRSLTDLERMIEEQDIINAIHIARKTVPLDNEYLITRIKHTMISFGEYCQQFYDRANGKTHHL